MVDTDEYEIMRSEFHKINKEYPFPEPLEGSRGFLFNCYGFAFYTLGISDTLENLGVWETESILDKNTFPIERIDISVGDIVVLYDDEFSVVSHIAVITFTGANNDIRVLHKRGALDVRLCSMEVMLKDYEKFHNRYEFRRKIKKEKTIWDSPSVQDVV